MLPNDTTVICTNPGHCKNHPVRTLLSELSTQTEANDSSAQISALDTLKMDIKTQTVKEVVVNKMQAIDTIKPCNVSLLSEQTYTPLTIHEVRKAPEMKEPMQYDLLINAALFTFMLGLTAKYVLTCSGAWLNLFEDLRKEIAA
jgi:hypothetical protein